MKKFLLRLDDACEWLNIQNWQLMEELLDKYSIKPLVGVIPFCEDRLLLTYDHLNNFWEMVNRWKNKGWEIALHGFNHVYSSTSGGINPINKRSEFAGEPLDIQKEKIRNGVRIFQQNGINPKVFFAPSHTFDNNTLIAIKEESEIRIISDTIAWDSYSSNGFTFVPVQSGKARNLPFKVVTFCYHPNSMKKNDFEYLEKFLSKHFKLFSSFPLCETKRKKTILDKLLTAVYMRKHR